jgi:hypothetical protein
MAIETERDRNSDAALEALFEEARHDGPRPDLVARVLADAAAVQAAAAPAVPPARRAGFFRNPPGFVAALGGWGGFGGVTAAGLFGLAVGLWSPEAVDALSGGQFWSLSGGNGWTPDLSALVLEESDV